MTSEEKWQVPAPRSEAEGRDRMVFSCPQFHMILMLKSQIPRKNTPKKKRSHDADPPNFCHKRDFQILFFQKDARHS